MQSADEIFGTGKRKQNRSGAGGAWWIWMLHATWVILLVIGVWYGYVSWGYVNEGVEVPAIVIELAESSSDDGVSYSPVFEYAYRGQIYTYESINSSDPPTHDIGERTTLLVDPEKPTRARENSFWELWLLPVIMIPVAVIVAVIAIAAQFFFKPE